MKHPSIDEVLRRIRPLAPIHKAAHLRSLIFAEPRRSMRRQELEAALKNIVNRDLGMKPRKHWRVA